ncbi:MAG: M15 family metallopeptidase [Thomasclavelia sp.]|jgi:D-alanyl-D-alanine carboxypeptidase|nr:M15 family metallopeptidase [Thomasclavelia sp.]
MKKLNIKHIIIGVISIVVVVALVLMLLPRSSTPTKTTKKATNEYSTLSYYHKDYLKRYNAYKKANPKLSTKDIVTRVNMGLDQDNWYTNIINQTKPNDVDTLVNKVYKLDESYAPSDLVNINTDLDSYNSSYKNHQVRKVVYDDFQALRKACKEKGFSLYVVSGYRSTKWQTEIYNHNASVYGTEETDKTCSRPGHSEHTTGLGMDIALDDKKFQDVETHPDYKWFVSKLADYGFIIRYPKDKESLTGYSYECWHIRYLGKSLAKKVTNSSLTYDEYYARNN